MADPFVAEIRILGCNFAPVGWAACDGQLLPISQNTALFSLLGTNYGGDGRSNFALPNLQGSFGIGAGQGPGLSSRQLGETGGVAKVTLLTAEIPSHSHQLISTASSSSGSPSDKMPAPTGNGASAYRIPGATAAMAPDALLSTGGTINGTQAHENRQPYLGMMFCIALQGIFPPRS